MCNSRVFMRSKKSNDDSTIDDSAKTTDIPAEYENTKVMTGVVVNVGTDMSIIVEPDEGDEARACGDRIAVDVSGLEICDSMEGSRIEVIYEDEIKNETYFPQIEPLECNVINDLRGSKYEGQWMYYDNKDDLIIEEYPGGERRDLIIDMIYDDCFIAENVFPLPLRYKLNGKLSDEWCVGDQIEVEYDSMVYLEDYSKAEGEFKEVRESYFKLDENVCYKPVIYLYPEKEMNVKTELNIDGELTCTYPDYNNGWEVTAKPDGTLTDESGQIYNYLYWEGTTQVKYDFTKGFCVKGEDTAAFLENALEKLGLTRKEANEFIVFWLPLMQENPYNIISFQTDVYTEAAKLEVMPKPDTLIRVFMAWKPASSYVEMKEQKLSASERKGFTVVEWGGAKQE